MKKSVIIFAPLVRYFVLLAAFVQTGCKEAKQQSEMESVANRPNILLIVADDLGFTDLGCYGGEIRTPHLDTLALSGIRNTAFYTAPTCSPTRAMLLTGVDNHRNGYGTMEGDWAYNQKGLPGYEGYLNFDVVPISTLLQQAGYHTSIAGKWHQAYPASEKSLWPDQRGFDQSFCLLQGGAGHFGDAQPLFSFYEKTLYAENGELIEKLPEDFYSSDYYAQKTIEFIRQSQEEEKPFFSMLTFTAPHWPLQVPDEDIDLYKSRYDSGYEVIARQRVENARKLRILPASTTVPPTSPNVQPWNQLSSDAQQYAARTMEIYAAMVERMDENIGKVLQHLKESGLYENTLIIFMSDNGAEGNSIWGIRDTKEWVASKFDNSLANIGRKNSYLFTGPSWAQVSTGPFRWYKGFASEGGVRSPMIIHFPEIKLKQGSVNPDFVSVMDIAPTILEWTKVSHPAPSFNGKRIFPMDGRSLIPWLTGSEETPHPKGVAHCWELYGRRGVLKGKWKAEYMDKPYGTGKWELYNLEKDLCETENLAEKEPAILHDMTYEWARYAKKYKVILPAEKVAYGTDEIWIDKN